MGERLYRYQQLLTDGLSREGISQSLMAQGLQRVTRGVYTEDEVNDATLRRALFLRMPQGALLGHQSAAALYGFGVLPVNEVHVVVPVGVGRPEIRGVVAHETVLPVVDYRVIDGVPCVPPDRAAVDLARGAQPLDAIAVLDAALRSGACTPSSLADEVAAHRGLRNVCQARRLIGLADGRAECPQESHLRLRLIDGHLPTPEPQVWVYDDRGRQLYRLDLAYRAKRIGIEYDGRSHVDRDRLRADRARMNWLEANGWRMRYFTDVDLYRRPAHLLAVVRQVIG